MPTVARATRTAQFEQRFPRYQALVAKMESGAVPVAAEGQSVALSESDRDLAYSVLAQKDTNGLLTVEFLTGSGFPLVHSGYLYSLSGTVQPGSFFHSRWPLRTQVRPKWFRIAD